VSDSPLRSAVDVAEPPQRRAAVTEPGLGEALRAAVQFLTRIPLGTRPVDVLALARCPAYFPLVGTLIGGLAAAVLLGGGQLWPIWLAVLTALAAEALLTGALHEDGLADCCDALGGGWTRDDVLAILKDSRLGTYGALGLGLAVSLRAGALAAIVQQQGLERWPIWCAALIASAAVGRWAMVLMLVAVPPIPERESLSRSMSGSSGRELLLATLWTLPAAVWMAVQMPEQAALAALLLALAVLWFARLVKRRLGGTTGDCLGCIAYLSQVVVLLAAAARWPT
jgi:adenosylcobinamide-GDP ribazoletransferase